MTIDKLTLTQLYAMQDELTSCMHSILSQGSESFPKPASNALLSPAVIKHLADAMCEMLYPGCTTGEKASPRIPAREAENLQRYRWYGKAHYLQGRSDDINFATSVSDEEVRAWHEGYDAEQACQERKIERAADLEIGREDSFPGDTDGDTLFHCPGCAAPVRETGYCSQCEKSAEEQYDTWCRIGVSCKRRGMQSIKEFVSSPTPSQHAAWYAGYRKAECEII